MYNFPEKLLGIIKHFSAEFSLHLDAWSLKKSRKALKMEFLPPKNEPLRF